MKKRSRPRARKLYNETAEITNADSKIAQLKEVIRRADIHADEPLGYDARIELLTTLIEAGGYLEMFAPFVWCLSLCDHKPEDYSDEDLFPYFNRILRESSLLPHIAMDRLEGMIADLERRYVRHGYHLRCVYAVELIQAMTAGQHERVGEVRRKYLAAGPEPDRCRACDVQLNFEYFLFLGEDERAIDVADPLLNGSLECGPVPRQTFAEVLVPLVKLGRLDEALEYHRWGYEMIQGRNYFSYDASMHMLFLALTGNLAKATHLLGFYVPFPKPPLLADHESRFDFSLAARFVLERVRAAGQTSLDLNFPTEFPAFESSRHYDVVSLEAWFLADAQRLAARFDARHGNDYFQGAIRENLALSSFVSPIDPERFKDDDQS